MLVSAGHTHTAVLPPCSGPVIGRDERACRLWNVIDDRPGLDMDIEVLDPIAGASLLLYHLSTLCLLCFVTS